MIDLDKMARSISEPIIAGLENAFDHQLYHAPDGFGGMSKDEWVADVLGHIADAIHHDREPTNDR